MYVGKYNIHGSYGVAMSLLIDDLVLFFSQAVVLYWGVEQRSKREVFQGKQA